MISKFQLIFDLCIAGLIVSVRAEEEEKYHHKLHHKQVMIDHLRSKLNRYQVSSSYRF